ncbi:MAG: rRNA maturation RNase YbeY [Planctomycetales bacterium]
MPPPFIVKLVGLKLAPRIPPVIEIEINNAQTALAVDEPRLEQIARIVLEGENANNAQVSLAVVDDATLHALTRRFLKHDYPTDVLSFPLETEEGWEGEVVVSAETAVRQAEELGWASEQELALYVIHGLLHLTGQDDVSPEAAAEMRRKESHYLEKLGWTKPD